MRLWWARLVCAFLGHDPDIEHYVQGSFELHCKRCDNVDRI